MGIKRIDGKRELACQLHPATDRWMMGDRYGKVIRQVKPNRIDPKDEFYRVKLDKSGKVLTFHVSNIIEFFER